MFRIAICDDSERDLRLNLDMVNKWKDDNSDSEIVVEAFHSPNDLLESHAEDMYHLWILDIVMPERDGISLAREIRKKGDETMVIYTSSTTEYAMDAFGIHALGYLPKPVEYTELKKTLDMTKTLYDARSQKYIHIMGDEGPQKVPVMDITYVENIGRNVRYNLRSGREIKAGRRNGTFEEVVAPLADEKEFVQTHKSFFVNLKYIKSIRENHVLLDNGTEIPVAKHCKTELQNKYMAYTFGDEII